MFLLKSVYVNKAGNTFYIW